MSTIAELFQDFMNYVWDAAPVEIYNKYKNALYAAEILGGELDQVLDDHEPQESVCCVFPDDSYVNIIVSDNVGWGLAEKTTA